MKKQEVSLYLKLLEEQRIDPNFFCSEPYIRLCGGECYEDQGWVWIEDSDWILFPPLIAVNVALSTLYPKKQIWSDFVNHDVNEFSYFTKNPTFVDFEYIFDPNNFQNLSGGKWETYRKNIRKWPKQNETWKYKVSDDQKSFKLLADWLECKKKIVEDGELIAKFLVTETGVFRKNLYDERGELVAINIWDENYKYINFRYCIVKEKQPFLDEFARYLFYIDIAKQGKLVNDGGSLGNAGLEHFKDKLNPVRKRKVYSWL